MSTGFCAGPRGPMRVWEGSVPGVGRSGFRHARPTCDHTFLNHKAWHRTPVTLQSGGTEPSAFGGWVSEMAQNPGILAWGSKDRRVLCTIPWEPCTEPTPRFNSSQRAEGSVRAETARCGFGGVLYHSAVAMSFEAAASPAIIRFSTIIPGTEPQRPCNEVVQDPLRLATSQSERHRTQGFLRDVAGIVGFCADLHGRLQRAGTDPTVRCPVP